MSRDSAVQAGLGSELCGLVCPMFSVHGGRSVSDMAPALPRSADAVVFIQVFAFWYLRRRNPPSNVNSDGTHLPWKLVGWLEFHSGPRWIFTVISTPILQATAEF